MRRRDFTVNAMARRLDDRRARRPARRPRRPRSGACCAPSRRTSFARGPAAPRARAPLRLAARLRAGRAELLEQMREEAPAVQLVSGERIGGGLAADGMGELSKLLLGAEPAQRAAARARHGRARRAAARVRARDRLRPGEPLPRPHGRRAHVRGRPGSRRRGLLAARCGSRRSSTISASRTSPGAAPTGGSTTTRSPASPTTARAGRRRARLGGAAPAPLSERAARARRADRAPPHVPAREGRRPPGAAVLARTATSSRST